MSNATTTERLLYTAEAVKGIHNAIARKGVSMSRTTPLKEFEGKIDSISTEGGSELITIAISGLSSGAAVSIYYSGYTYTEDFVGEDLNLTIPGNEYYTVKFSNITGYITPAKHEYKAEVGNSREISVEYTPTENATIYFDNSEEVSDQANISGDIGIGSIASIKQKCGRCLVKQRESGTYYRFLDADNSNLYIDGAPALTDGTEGDVMWYHPDIYLKNTAPDSAESSLMFSETEIDGGNPIDVFPAGLIGAYKASKNDSDEMCSVSGGPPTGSINSANWDVYAANKGEGWSIITYNDHRLIAALFYAIYGERNSQTVLGAGALDYNGGLTGNTNYLGNNDSVSAVADEACNFLGIEGVHGWISEWVSGVVINGGIWTITNEDGTTREVAGSTGTEYITRMAFQDSDIFDLVPTALGGSSSTHFCDFNYGSTDSGRVLDRASCNTITNGGVSYASTSNDSSSTYANIGSRLAFHGTATEITDTEEFKAL